MAEALALLRKQLAAFNVACRAYLHARLPMTIIGQWVGSTPQPMLHVNRFGDIDPAGRERHSASALMMVGTNSLCVARKKSFERTFPGLLHHRRAVFGRLCKSLVGVIICKQE